MIELRDVVLSYGDRTILDHINLTIQDGETLVILGGSGAGKSTLIKLIIGLEKPTSGQIFIDGEEITNKSEDEMNEMRRKMGLVFQYSALFDSLTVRDNITFGLRVRMKLSPEEEAAMVAKTLERVDLPGIEDLYANELSGGMRKRVSLARAIVMEPSILLYDEPTSGLDPITSGTISRLIRTIQKNLHCTSIVVTHDMQSAFYVGDRLALLHQGKFVEVAVAEQFRKSTHPYVQQFIHGYPTLEEAEKIMQEKGGPNEVDNRS